MCAGHIHFIFWRIFSTVHPPNVAGPHIDRRQVRRYNEQAFRICTPQVMRWWAIMGYLRVYLDDKLTDQFELVKDRLTIGRSAENDLVLGNSGVSRHHATIVREGSHFFIEDNKSSNGVFLNKERVERAQLNFWDEIQIYNFVLKFMAVPRRGV